MDVVLTESGSTVRRYNKRYINHQATKIKLMYADFLKELTIDIDQVAFAEYGCFKSNKIFRYCNIIHHILFHIRLIGLLLHPVKKWTLYLIRLSYCLKYENICIEEYYNLMEMKERIKAHVAEQIMKSITYHRVKTLTIPSYWHTTKFVWYLMLYYNTYNIKTYRMKSNTLHYIFIDSHSKTMGTFVHRKLYTSSYHIANIYGDIAINKFIYIGHNLHLSPSSHHSTG